MKYYPEHLHLGNLDIGSGNGVQLTLSDRIDRKILDRQWAGDFEYLTMIMVYNINIYFIGEFMIMDSKSEYEFKFTLCRDNLLSTYRISKVCITGIHLMLSPSSSYNISTTTHFSKGITINAIIS